MRMFLKTKWLCISLFDQLFISVYAQPNKRVYILTKIHIDLEGHG